MMPDPLLHTHALDCSMRSYSFAVWLRWALVSGVGCAGHLVYPAAAVAVVVNPTDNSQRFYQGHTDDIVCLALDPSRSLCATGNR